MPAPDTNHDPVTLALQALAWTLGDSQRASRLLDLTGLSVADLKRSADSRATQAALLGFLEAYEPDLIACAGAIGVTPAALVAAHRALDA